MPAGEDGIDIRDCSTQRGATSESLRVDAPGSSHMSSNSGELRILGVYGQGEGSLAVDGHDTLFAASEPEALSSLSADHSLAKSLNCSVRLVHLEELTGHQGGRMGRPGVLGGKVIPNNANMIHTHEEPYVCDQCMMCFSRKGYLKVHMRTHSGEKPFRCDQCTKRFSQSGSLKVHMRTHSGEKPYKCAHCIKCFSQNGALKVHMRTHSGEKPYKCDQCTMSFSLKSHMKGHMRTHSGENPYKCEQCTMRFRKESSLKIHMWTHPGEKPYRCDQCTMRFKKKSHLKIHLMIHSGDKPYKCDQCTKRYTHISALKTHMRTHTGETPYKCDQCTKRFSLKGTLNRHITTHSGEKPYKCDQCTKRFGEKSKLKRHMRTHSGGKPYGCDQYMKSSVVEQEHFQWDGQEVCDAFGDRSTQRSATSESLGVDAPGSSHLASHREELKIVIVHEEGDGQLVVDGHDTLFTASEVEALNSLSADHSAAKSLERGERLFCREELSVQVGNHLLIHHPKEKLPLLQLQHTPIESTHLCDSICH
ncbi:zinc finger protein 260-like isoform X1 [Gadus macrocephalus]|uniref:zinc finger protein 260-like isoform X1 n=2 Tax=Gadus macrocephalus TaxID=80720 RepID=UPI0028CB77AE|nr:zinc finger protein 260-like isoform X1 [Gadus macrocephalus]XP_059905215.1 zinc finger protein 260-like isoform X1 [Gadus macrocephalus]XP_059905216.1 zinc finger protein 260-like isoform X1 [Gadus macrocephalus]XP_059905217.1 zinc finger protein 260-like isoform X1 [Gadus macrocephalus]